MAWKPVAYASPGEVAAAGVVLPLVAITVVALRFNTRRKQRASYGPDEWFIVAALLLNIAMGIIMIYGVAKKVLGYNTPIVEYSTPEEALFGTVPQITLTGKLVYSFQLLMIVCYGCTKISVIFFCRRVFVVERKTAANWVTIVFIFVMAAWCLGWLFAFAFDCGTHFSANWGPAEDIIKFCGGGQTGEKGLAISDLLTDLMVIGLPLPMIWRLHASTGKKLLVTVGFLLGTMSIAASLARIAIYYRIFSHGSDPTRDRDQTVTITIYWSMIEASLAIIAACLPSLRLVINPKSAASLVASLRSALSLQSLPGSNHSKGSKGSNHSQKRSQAHTDKYSRMDDASSTASKTRLHGDVQSEAPALPEMPDAIYVQKRFGQTENMV